jgi:preprotein translocase subunit YajC
MQRIVYTNKMGMPMSIVGKIIRKQSKTITIALAENDMLMTIDRKSVESITEAKEEIVKE